MWNCSKKRWAKCTIYYSQLQVFPKIGELGGVSYNPKITFLVLRFLSSLK
jgi:hypothetical protein